MAAIVRYDRVPYPNPVSIKNAGSKALQAGQIVGVKQLESREVYTVDTAAAGDMLVMVAPSILFYDETKTEFDFELKQHEICRGYILQKGEMYTVAKALFDGANEAGSKITVAEKEVAVVREVVNYEGQDSIVIEIL